MSSHREAPEISKDAVADNTDTYAFVSPDQPDTVTILTNYIPLEAAASGPNFYEFGDDVLYSIHVINSGTALPDITYEFRFETRVRNENPFLYNNGPAASLDDPHFNRRQFYSVTKVRGSRDTGPLARPSRPPRRQIKEAHRERRTRCRPHSEPVVLDIGGKMGALVVYADVDLIDTPIEISREGQDAAPGSPACPGTTAAAPHVPRRGVRSSRPRHLHPVAARQGPSDGSHDHRRTGHRT